MSSTRVETRVEQRPGEVSPLGVMLVTTAAVVLGLVLVVIVG